jgi:hypothetical protein
MITIFSRYIVQCLKGVGHNSYQGHVNDSGVFWGVSHRAAHRNCIDRYTVFFLQVPTPYRQR